MSHTIHIDIETLDTQNTAVVVEIGCLVTLGEEILGSSFYARLDITSQLVRGRTVSEQTLNWLREQGQEFDLRGEPVVSPEDGLKKLWATVEKYTQDPTTNVVTRGNFDLPILRNLTSTYSKELLGNSNASVIHYRQEMDLRSVERFVYGRFPEAKEHIEKKVNDFKTTSGKTAHRALDDCYIQHVQWVELNKALDNTLQ